MDEELLDEMIKKRVNDLTLENNRLKKELEDAVKVIEYYEDVVNYDACESYSVYYYLYDEQDEVGKRAREFLKRIKDKNK